MPEDKEEIEILINIEKDNCDILLNTSGDSLHKR